MHHKIILGDCLKELKKIEEGSIDLIITDPPWFISQEIKIHRSMNPKKYKYVGKDISLDFGPWDHFESEEEYLKFTRKWFTECVRVLRDGGHLITFFDIMRITHLVNLAKELNCIPRQVLFWRKTNPVPRARCVDFMVSLEAAPWFTKKTKSRKVATFNYKLGQQRNYVDSAIPGHTTKEDGKRIHPTQKPIKVIETWMKYLSNPGDIVLDLFAGSGPVGVAAEHLGRNSIQIEISPKYANLSYKRLKDVVAQTKLNSKQSTIEKIGF